MAPAGRLAAAFFLAVTAAISQPGLPQRIGFYQWAGVLPANAGGDLLTEARHRSVAIGARVFRLYVGARFDYIHPPYSPRRFSRDGISEPLTPARILRIPRYRDVLEDPKIDTVILTVYPISDYGGGPDDLNLQRPWSDREREWEFTQTSELCRYLYQEFGVLDKTVIIANSEADDKMLDIMNYTGSPKMAVENIRHWTQTRFEAVRAARAAHSSARLRILHAFEISLVNLRIAKQGGGFGKAPFPEPAQKRRGWNALNDVVPHVSFDLLSYSAYESTNSPFETRQPDIDPAETGSRLARDLDLIQSKARNSVSPVGHSVSASSWSESLDMPATASSISRQAAFCPGCKARYKPPSTGDVPTLCCGRFSTPPATEMPPGASGCMTGEGRRPVSNTPAASVIQSGVASRSCSRKASVLGKHSNKELRSTPPSQRPRLPQDPATQQPVKRVFRYDIDLAPQEMLKFMDEVRGEPRRRVGPSVDE